jgi:ribosomal protein S18 acetylase RimI-like enzyme
MTDVFPDFYHIVEMMGMFRMRITKGIFNPYIDPGTAPGEVIPLTRSDSAGISALLDLTSEADGRDPRDVFFEPGLVDAGYYRGLRIDGELIAVAGTHIVSKPSSVAAVGNVAVHPDYRRQGLGGLVSQVTTQALLDDGYEMIVLNVRQNNQAANKIYRRLGYKQITPFIEGIAERH